MDNQLQSRSDVPVRARVPAIAVKTALGRLTEVATPLVVIVALDGNALTLTSHLESGEWWASVTVPVIERRPDSVDAQVLVSRMPLTEAVELEAQLNPDFACEVTILDGELLRYGADALAASTEGAFTPRPRLESARTVRRGIALPEVLADGSGRLEIDTILLQIPAPLHERFGPRSITAVDLYETSGRYLVAGHTGEADSTNRLTLAGFVTVGENRS